MAGAEVPPARDTVGAYRHAHAGGGAGNDGFNRGAQIVQALAAEAGRGQRLEQRRGRNPVAAPDRVALDVFHRAGDEPREPARDVCRPALDVHAAGARHRVVPDGAAVIGAEERGQLIVG